MSNTHDELKEQYRLDELLHPEGKPWEWWEHNGPGCYNWETMTWPPGWYEDVEYRRKDTAPNWGEELSHKEVAECDDWPDFIIKTNEQGVMCIRDVDDKVWTEKAGWTYKPRISLLRHFKQRRAQALLEQEPTNEHLEKAKEVVQKMVEQMPYGNTKDNPLSERHLMAANNIEILQRIEALEEKISHLMDSKPKEDTFDPQLGTYWKSIEGNNIFLLCTPANGRYVLIHMCNGCRWSTEADSAVGAFGVDGRERLTQISIQEAFEALS